LTSQNITIIKYIIIADSYINFRFSMFRLVLVGFCGCQTQFSGKVVEIGGRFNRDFLGSVYKKPKSRK
jgi:hypothetical protein